MDDMSETCPPDLNYEELMKVLEEENQQDNIGREERSSRKRQRDDEDDGNVSLTGFDDEEDVVADDVVLEDVGDGSANGGSNVREDVPDAQDDALMFDDDPLW
ncbi:hypothetical protein LINPERHAP2_LOCUS34879 [Linum perenne]